MGIRHSKRKGNIVLYQFTNEGLHVHTVSGLVYTTGDGTGVIGSFAICEESSLAIFLRCFSDFFFSFFSLGDEVLP